MAFVESKTSLIKKALTLTTPVFFGYIAIGIAFGIMMTAANYSWYLALFMSLFVFTGTGQYFAVALFSAGTPLLEIMLVEFLLSIRQIFYSLAFINKYRGTGKIKPYLIFAITDETFALIQGLGQVEEKTKTRLYLYISALDQLYWCLGTIIGALGAGVLVKYNLGQYLEGVDFALTALLIVILIDQIKNSKQFLSPIVGLVLAIVALVLYKTGILASSNIIWTCICTGLAVMLLLKGKSYFIANKEEATK